MSYQLQIVAHWPDEIQLFIPWVFPHDGALGRLATYQSADALRARLHQAHIASDTAKELEAMLEKALAFPGATVVCPYAELSDEQLGILGFHIESRCGLHQN
jgi:hypothetical protein